MAAADEREEQPAFDPLLLSRLRVTSRVASALVMAIAVFVLVGWALNVEVLRSVIPGLTSMNPGGTALAFLLSGAALWSLTSSQPTVRLTRVARAMAGFVVVLTVLRLALYMFGLEWGPDQWLFREKLDLYQPPNRMAPNTALGLLLIAIALLVLDLETRRGGRPSQWLGLGAALLALVTLIGYACIAAVLIGVQSYVPMALNSAVTLGLLVIGLLAARPDRGLMAVLSRRQTGSVMARRLLPASILAPAAFAGLASAAGRAGWIDLSFGVSLFVVATIVLFAALIWWNAVSLNQIDAERTRVQKELHEKGSILQSVLNSMGDGVVVADRDGRFLLFNPIAERILGLGASDTRPDDWTSHYGLFHPETGEPLPIDDIPLVKAIRGQSTNQQELLIRNPQLPEGVHISATARPLKGEEGLEGGVVVFQDITQRRRAADAIRRARDEANAANRAKSDFLANMSHEIRTPMNAVIGMTELVLDTELSDMQRTYLRIVKDSAESLLSLINDILDFSKIEAGKLELDRTQFQLRDLLGDTMKTLSMRTRGKDLELAFHVAPEVPEYLVGDPHRLRQVVTNLVGNALKFTERGEVVLDVSRDDARPPAPTNGTSSMNGSGPNGSHPDHASDVNDQVRIHVAVRDTGIGIPADKLHLLFNAFSQVDASTTRRYGGTGLGLAITARLVPLMNGRAWVESEPGKGSTFHFTAGFEKDCSPPPPPATPEALKNLRVLVVDDNATNRLILQEILVGWGLRPVCLASANAAVDQLRLAIDQNDPFRIVLSDVHMPDVDGFELTSRIRQDGRFGSTVIMMLSSGAEPGDVSRCRELGVLSHLIKPIKASELYAAIAAAMGTVIHSQSQKASDKENCRPLKILLAEDSKANQQLALGVLRKWGHTLTIANNGLEAVEAFQQGKFDVILMDVQMPEMDGLQATARIRELERQTRQHIPIVAMTAHAMKGDREEFMDAGMDDYVTKPIRLPELRRALDGVVQKSLTPAAPAESGAKTAPAITTTAHESPDADGEADISFAEQSVQISQPPTWTLDWDDALRAVDGNMALFCEVLEELLKEWPRLLAELDRAATAGDAIALRRAAHTIRGSLQYFGFTETFRLAEKIEESVQTGDTGAVAGLLPSFHTQVYAVLAEVKRWLIESAI